MNNIPVFKPLIEKEELQAAHDSLVQGWLGMGASVGDFENSISDFLALEDRHIAAVSTGHAALHLALLVAGVGLGDEVITPSFNNIADFQAIIATGATPVFCDIDNDSLCIDIKKADSLVSKKTKAIIIMDYACMLSDYEAIEQFSEKYNLRVIHDAAHAFGSIYRGKKIGSFSDICIFSFDPVKTITCIDGGVVIVNNIQELEKIHEMRLIGMGQSSSVMYKNSRAWTYGVKQLGFRYHMANLHAAIGLSQLAKMPTIEKKRRLASELYNDLLKDVSDVIVPKTNYKGIVPFLYYIRVPEDNRAQLREYLLEKGIDTGIHWQPGHWFELFENCRHGDLSVTESVSKEILSLPLSSEIKKDEIIFISEAIHEFFQI